MVPPDDEVSEVSSFEVGFGTGGLKKPLGTSVPKNHFSFFDLRFLYDPGVIGFGSWDIDIDV